MKNIIAVFLIIFSIAAAAVVNIPSVAKLRSYPTSVLELEARTMQMKIDAATITGISDNKIQKNELRKEKSYYQIEIIRRTFALEWLALGLGLFGLGLLALNFITRVESSRKVYKVRVHEIMPTELYVDEQEFYRRSQDSFPSKDEAMSWYETDPMRTCTYCGADSVKPLKGLMDQIQLITFYKKVPQSAKDLRIVFGTLWFVHPARELQCENCHQKVLR